MQSLTLRAKERPDQIITAQKDHGKWLRRRYNNTWGLQQFYATEEEPETGTCREGITCNI